jgi:hypothetical protein
MLEPPSTIDVCDTPTAETAAFGSRPAGSPALGRHRGLAAAVLAASPAPGGRRAPGGVWRWHVHHAYD